MMSALQWVVGQLVRIVMYGAILFARDGGCDSRMTAVLDMLPTRMVDHTPDRRRSRSVVGC